MSQPIEDKDKKIADLRSLLTQAKNKIEEYKAQLHNKEKEAEEIKRQNDKKIKMLEGDTENIIKQYEERLLYYKKTLQQNNQLIEKHQKGMQNASKNYEQLIKKIGSLYSITNKIFALSPSKDKDNSDAVQQLCQLQKCKQYLDSLEKFAEISDLELISKMMCIVVKNHQQSLNKRRQQRIQYVKKETSYQKSIEEEKGKIKKVQQQVESLKKQLIETRDKYQRSIDSMAKSKAKMQQQKTNEQFVKQLMIKLIMGPKDASLMALGILNKVLKFNEDELKMCEKKLK